jgi:hypothetical protein
MNKTTFAFAQDGKGREYVFQDDGEMDKNHGPENSVNDTTGEGVMYQKPAWGDMCPITTYRKYLSKLHPNCLDLWQRPLDTFFTEDPLWYCCKAIGVNTLGNFMPNISSMANLSKSYTNHCIRATAIVTLDDCGLEARHIMRITGHR